VLELGDRLRLALEALAKLGVLLQVLGQDLDRHVAVQTRVTGLVDLSHAASSNLGGDLIRTEADPHFERHG
jgi:hypothetical protein